MSLKIPVWCIPWQARKRMAEMQAHIDADRAAKLALVEEVVTEKAAHKETVQQKISSEMAHEEAKTEVVRLKHATESLTRWIFVTHGIDALAGQKTGDILKRRQG